MNVDWDGLHWKQIINQESFLTLVRYWMNSSMEILSSSLESSSSRMEVSSEQSAPLRRVLSSSFYRYPLRSESKYWKASMRDFLANNLERSESMVTNSV